MNHMCPKLSKYFQFSPRMLHVSVTGDIDLRPYVCKILQTQNKKAILIGLQLRIKNNGGRPQSPLSDQTLLL